jgi:hypothetical protein
VTRPEVLVVVGAHHDIVRGSPGADDNCSGLAGLLELIDQIRLSVPEQVRAAQQLLQRRDQVLASAQAEGDAVLAAARRQALEHLADR